MPKSNFSVLITFTFFALCLIFWLQTDTLKSTFTTSAGDMLVPSDAEVDRLLLHELLAKQAKEGKQPTDTWNVADVPVQEVEPIFAKPLRRPKPLGYKHASPFGENDPRPGVYNLGNPGVDESHIIDPAIYDFGHMAEKKTA